MSKLEPELADPGRGVTGLAYYQAKLYEGVKVQETDQAPSEPATEPFLIHEVIPGTQAAFRPLATAAPVEYEEPGGSAEELEGFRLSAAQAGVWAVAGSPDPLAGITALRLDESGLRQVPLSDPSGFLRAGTQLRGLAADPGTAAAWVSVKENNEAGAGVRAHVALIGADGKVETVAPLPLEGEGGGPTRTGRADRLRGGRTVLDGDRHGLALPPRPTPGATDTALHTGLISFRPADNSLPSEPPVFLPEDNSGANEEKEKEKLEIIQEPLPKRKPALLAKLHQKLVGHTLELTFVLRAKAHVQLLARRQGAVVAKTKRYTMAAGPGSLRLTLDPRRWPTKLDLQVHEVKGKKK